MKKKRANYRQDYVMTARINGQVVSISKFRKSTKVMDRLLREWGFGKEVTVTKESSR